MINNYYVYFVNVIFTYSNTSNYATRRSTHIMSKKYLFVAFDYQLDEFAKYLIKAYTEWPLPSAIIDPKDIKDRLTNKFVFYDNYVGVKDDLICIAVQWLQSHYTHKKDKPEEPYIAWFAVSAIMMNDYHDVSIAFLEEQYWKHPKIYSRAFACEDRNNRTRPVIKRNLKRIKCVIDMWYDTCLTHKRECTRRLDAMDALSKYHINIPSKRPPYDIYWYMHHKKPVKTYSDISDWSD